MEYLVVIPARGGSKGIPGKNIRLLGGKPLIQYTIEAARAVFLDEAIWVSTDDETIKAVAEETGLRVPGLRPPELARDETGMMEVLRYCLEQAEDRHGEIPVVVLLQPTSPLRNANHIEEALTHFTDDLDQLVSVKETKSNPYYTLFEERDHLLYPVKQGNFVRRQDCPVVYELNGAIYCFRRGLITGAITPDHKRMGKYLMEEQASIDIDSPLDWLVAEAYLTFDTHKTI